MKRFLLIAMLSTTALAQTPVPVARVADDGLVIDRVGEASKRDLPTDLLKRIVNEDIDLLRGKRPDGSYDYAKYERFEAGRVAKSFSIDFRKDKMETVEVRGSWIYRVVVEVPSRKLLVRKNRPVWVERVDVDYVPEGSTQTLHESYEVKAWMQPAEVRPFDLPAIAKQATAKVIATTEEKGGYGNVDVVLVQARIVDAADSPYAEAVGSAKAILRALDNNDVASMRASAKRLRASLGGGTPTPVPAPLPAVAAVAPRPAASELTVTAPDMDVATQLELQTELQMIEDLLTGTDAEKREGMDQLHQLLRRMRMSR
ncbi:MAG TPA: hypothetical protein VGQ76_01320 [Thermoanaerobaculia bacterium]|jgi:hypothetical protein|nr:hypothetical protein [Thermoanaerobaculia bacterium]